MINEPDLDIPPSQQAYQSAWAEVKQNQKDRLEAEQKLQDLKATLAGAVLSGQTKVLLRFAHSSLTA